MSSHLIPMESLIMSEKSITPKGLNKRSFYQCPISSLGNFSTYCFHDKEENYEVLNNRQQEMRQGYLIFIKRQNPILNNDTSFIRKVTNKTCFVDHCEHFFPHFFQRKRPNK
jgi:hypothetical protein